jgi:hypothetical protein
MAADPAAFSTHADVPPAPGAIPVIGTADLVDLVQRLDVFTQK